MISKIANTTAVIGIKIAKAAKPKAGNNAIKICSDPYAEDEMQSEDKIPNAYRLLNLWWPSEWRLSGLPKKRRFVV
jgi:hypothetical protein